MRKEVERVVGKELAQAQPFLLVDFIVGGILFLVTGELSAVHQQDLAVGVLCLVLTAVNLLAF